MKYHAVFKKELRHNSYTYILLWNDHQNMSLNEKSKVEKSIYSVLLFISQDRISIYVCVYTIKEQRKDKP